MNAHRKGNRTGPAWITYRCAALHTGRTIEEIETAAAGLTKKVLVSCGKSIPVVSYMEILDHFAPPIDHPESIEVAEELIATETDF